MRTLVILFVLYSNLMLSSMLGAYCETSFSLRSGYREDSLDWNIAGPDGYPDVLSELKWKDLRMWQVSGEFDITLPNNLYFSLEGDYAGIVYGKNRDSDYLGNNRTYEFLRSYADANDGEAFDVSGSIGYMMPIFCESLFDTLEFCPQIGYAYKEQRLSMKNGFLALNPYGDFIGPFDGLDTKYYASWFGPWIGFDLGYQFTCSLNLYAGFQYHIARYNGRGHWNLRVDFDKDFEHYGWAHGLYGKLGAEYAIWDCWAVGVLTSYQHYYLRHGHDKMYFKEPLDDKGNKVSSTRLNRVNWNSFRVEGYISYTF